MLLKQRIRLGNQKLERLKRAAALAELKQATIGKAAPTSKDMLPPSPLGLVLVPTRELAGQISLEAEKLFGFHNFRVATFVGRSVPII